MKLKKIILKEDNRQLNLKAGDSFYVELKESIDDLVDTKFEIGSKIVKFVELAQEEGFDEEKIAQAIAFIIGDGLKHTNIPLKNIINALRKY